MIADGHRAIVTRDCSTGAAKAAAGDRYPRRPAPQIDFDGKNRSSEAKGRLQSERTTLAQERSVMFSFSPFHSIADQRGDGLLPEFQRLLKPNEATLGEYRKVRAELCKVLSASRDATTDVPLPRASDHAPDASRTAGASIPFS